MTLTVFLEIFELKLGHIGAVHIILEGGQILVVCIADCKMEVDTAGVAGAAHSCDGLTGLYIITFLDFNGLGIKVNIGGNAHNFFTLHIEGMLDLYIAAVAASG